MNARVKQMIEHGVDVDKFPFASFCFGRGWRGHKTAAAAWKAAKADAIEFAEEYGGGAPQHLAACTSDGKAV